MNERRLDDEMEKLTIITKDALGDIGEAACMSVLSEFGATLVNLNEEKRNHRGIGLTFLDGEGVFVERGGTGVVQVEARLRNPNNNATYNRPERDRIKTPLSKVARAEHQAAERNAPLFWSIVLFYPYNEDNVLCFFFLTTNEFMQGNGHCTKGDRYRYFHTQRALQSFALRKGGSKPAPRAGILFYMRIYTANAIREIKEIAVRRDVRDTIDGFRRLPFVGLQEWTGHPTNLDSLDYIEIPFLK